MQHNYSGSGSSSDGGASASNSAQTSGAPHTSVQIHDAVTAASARAASQSAAAAAAASSVPNDPPTDPSQEASQGIAVPHPSKSAHLHLLYSGNNTLWMDGRFITGPGVEWFVGTFLVILIPGTVFLATTSVKRTLCGANLALECAP